MSINNACGRWDINEGDLKILDVLLTELGSAEHADFIEGIKKARTMPNGFQSTNQILSIPGLQAEIKQRLMNEITLHADLMLLIKFQVVYFKTSYQKKSR